MFSTQYVTITINFVHFNIHINMELYRHFMTVLQSKKFYYVGKLMAMGLANGGSGYPYMAPPMFEYLCGADIAEICVTDLDVPNLEVRQLIQKVCPIHVARYHLLLEHFCRKHYFDHFFPVLMYFL